MFNQICIVHPTTTGRWKSHNQIDNKMKTKNWMFVIIVGILSLFVNASILKAQTAPDQDAVDKAGMKYRAIIKGLKEKNGPDLGFSKMSPSGKIDLLEYITIFDDFVTFYSLFNTAEEEEMIFFKNAFKAGDVYTIFCIGRNLNHEVDQLRKDHNTQGDRVLSSNVAMAFQRGLIAKLAQLEPEIALMARKFQDRILSVVMRGTAGMDASVGDGDLLGSVLALSTLKEEGFGMLLTSLPGEAYDEMIFEPLRAFKENSLIPALRYYENPESADWQRAIAKKIIKKTDFTDEKVFDKVVEALLHGQYYPQPSGVEWNDWREVIVERAHGNPEMVEYITSKFFPKLNAEEKAKLIPYLNRISPATISDASK
jgi:hypothetical protein